MAYLSLSELRQRLGLIDSADDALLTSAATAAERAIDLHCGRTFTVPTATSARSFVTDGRSRLLDVHDIASASGLTVSVFGTPMDTSVLTLEPLDGIGPDMRPGWPFTRIRRTDGGIWPLSIVGAPNLTITAMWGWPAVPEPVKAATANLARDIFRSKDAAFGVAGMGDMGVLRIKSDALTQSLLQPYRRSWGIA